jgi:hypothetical protein
VSEREILGADDRVATVAVMISRGHSSAQIVRSLRRKWKVGRSTAYRYVQRAREMLVDASGMSAAEMTAQQASRLEAIIQARGTPPSAKVAAIAEYNKLFGLHRPKKFSLPECQDRGLTLHQIVRQVEERRRAKVIDADFVKADVAKLLSPSEQSEGEVHPE